MDKELLHNIVKNNKNPKDSKCEKCGIVFEEAEFRWYVDLRSFANFPEDTKVYCRKCFEPIRKIL